MEAGSVVEGAGVGLGGCGAASWASAAVAVGTGSLVTTQVVVNVGMNIGVLPVTGIPLPFLSHGGSSLVSFGVLVGVLQSMYLRRHKIQFTH